MLSRKLYGPGQRCIGVEVLHTGTSPEQNFSRRLVMDAVADGWMRIEGDQLKVSTNGEPLVYRLKREPGYYVKSTGERIPVSQLAWERMLSSGIGDMTRREALAFLAGKGLPETDYEVTMAYECVLNAEQHEQFRAIKKEGLIVANLVFNIGLGQVVHYYRKVDENDPSTAELYVIAINTTATDTTLRRLDTVAAIEADANTAEVTNSGYARKVLTDADLTAFAPDDVNDRVDLDIPDQTWTGVAAGSAWTDIVIAYGLNAGADSAKVPLTLHDFPITPSGADITMQVATAGFYRATPV